MVITINGIPVYNALVNDEDTGMFKISLVDDPAVQSNFLAFDSSKKPMMYAVQDEEKRLVRGVVMRADFPIYRYDKSFGEYYVIYKADTIRTMAEKYLLESRQNDVNLMHVEGSDVKGVQMVQYFIKDSAAGVNPEGFADIADGSLFAEFHIINDDVWAEVKAGTYKGFSLEGVFEFVPEQDKERVETIVDTLEGKFSKLKYFSMSKVKKFKEMLVKAFAVFNNITTDKGVLAWDGDEDLKVGDTIYVEDAEGNRTPAPDGDYITEDNKVIKVAEGKVAEITDSEAEEAPETETETEKKAEEVTEEYNSVATDKGVLSWEGTEDLKAGDVVYVEDAEGNKTTAADGDYTTEDGKVIKVADGVVAEIVDDKAEVSEEEVKAKRISKFNKIKAAFEESYADKMEEIRKAIYKLRNSDEYWYLYDSGDDFAVIDVMDEETWEDHYFRYSIKWNEDGSAEASDETEVKIMFVPMDMESPFAKGNEDEMAALKAENAQFRSELETLKAENEALKQQPAAKPAHEETLSTMGRTPKGDKGIAKLQHYLSL